MFPKLLLDFDSDQIIETRGTADASRTVLGGTAENTQQTNMKMTATLGILVLASLAGAAASSGVPGDADCTGLEFLQSRPEDFSTLLTLIGTAADKALDTFYSGATNSSIVFTFFAYVPIPTRREFLCLFVCR